MKPPSAETLARQAEALDRAENGQSMANFVPIFEGFAAKGIPVDDIRPRENVFTYNAWKAKGRQVRKGEHGVRCLTFIKCREKGRAVEIGCDTSPADAGKKKGFTRPWTTTVFHISQTDPIGTPRTDTPPAEDYACSDRAYEDACERATSY